MFFKNYDDEIKAIEISYGNKEYESVIDNGLPLLRKLKKRQRKRIIELIALSYFKSGQESKAIPYFKKIAKHSTSSDDWFNLASAAIMAGEIDKGMSAFSKALDLYYRKGTENNLPPGYMSFYVMQAFRDIKEYDLAFVQLMKLKDVYCSLKTTDDTFLHLQGLPFLSHVLNASRPFILEQSIEDPREWLEEFANCIDQDGSEAIYKFMNDLRL